MQHYLHQGQARVKRAARTAGLSGAPRTNLSEANHSSVNYLESLKHTVDVLRAKEDEGFRLYVSYVLAG